MESMCEDAPVPEGRADVEKLADALLAVVESDSGSTD
jgi:hypothetical protein